MTVREDGLWLPSKVMPTEAKKEGGTYFDDEMEDMDAALTRAQRNSLDMRAHLNARKDHRVYVDSVESRQEMRKVLNLWRESGEIGHNPDIKIDYRIAPGTIRIGE